MTPRFVGAVAATGMTLVSIGRGDYTPIALLWVAAAFVIGMLLAAMYGAARELYIDPAVEQRRRDRSILESIGVATHPSNSDTE